MLAEELYRARLRSLLAGLLGEGHAAPTERREKPASSTLLRWK